jgi:radical SAM family uncharacterized protein
VDYREILFDIEKPARYLGGEYNLPEKKGDFAVSCCMAFPDVYEVGMSNQGLNLLYSILNDEADCVCERVFAPWTDMADKLRENGLKLRSLETARELKSFDILGFSLSYELAYTTMLYMLDLGGIPFYAKERGEEYPLLVAGGTCAANPEPFAEFFDIICVGDGEEFIIKLKTAVNKHKGNKRKILEEMRAVEGAYIPLFYGEDANYTVIKTSIVDFENAPYIKKPLVASLGIVHNRPVVELYRGCGGGCRFCQAGFLNRPLRFRSKDRVCYLAKNAIDTTGADELGLSSLSTGDYPYIQEAVSELSEYCTQNSVKLQLPSLRLDTFKSEISAMSRISSLTFAPEAGTQRLRNVINKNVSDEDIERTMRLAFKQGYKSVKLYFMVGLPTETDTDLLGISKIVDSIKRIYHEEVGNHTLNITVSTSVFVPKPVTPFEKCAALSIAESTRRQRLVRDSLRRFRGVKYNWHEETASFWECVFARGGRELSELLVTAYKNGCVFDGWNDKFSNAKWFESATEARIDAEAYIREYGDNEAMPWSFIKFPVTSAYLRGEFKKAVTDAVTTRNCLTSGCNACGAQCKTAKTV